MPARARPILPHLAAPQVAEWWGDPGQQFALGSGAAGDPGLEHYLVGFEGRPNGYLQPYQVPQGGLGSQAPGTRGIDQCIGAPGHGARFMRAFVASRLLAGCARVVTDPSPANTRAIRVLMIRDSQPTSPA
jgi:aminoglycoside 6'-N-acetyltransferase